MSGKLSSMLEYYKVNSMRGLAEQEGLAKRPRISLRALLDGPEKRQDQVDRQLNAGDVNATYLNVYLQSDGCWAFRGSVFDHGSVYGDNFSAAAALLGLSTVPSPGWVFSGNVGHQTTNEWQVCGRDNTVRDNWDLITAQWDPASHHDHVHYILNQSSEITADDILKALYDIGKVVVAAYISGGDPSVIWAAVESDASDWNIRLPS